MAKPIAAIVGCGPCLKDLEDPEWLYENRYVVTLNDAVNRVPSHACVLVTYEAILKWWRDVDGEVNIVAICSQWHLGRIRRFMRRPTFPEIGSDEYEAFEEFAARCQTVPPDPCVTPGWDMSLTWALKYLGQDKGYEEIELYGVDFNEPQYAAQKLVADCYLRLLTEKVKVINRCPSSEFVSQWVEKGSPLGPEKRGRDRGDGTELEGREGSGEAAPGAVRPHDERGDRVPGGTRHDVDDRLGGLQVVATSDD